MTPLKVGDDVAAYPPLLSAPFKMRRLIALDTIPNSMPTSTSRFNNFERLLLATLEIPPGLCLDDIVKTLLLDFDILLSPFHNHFCVYAFTLRYPIL